MLKPRAGAVCSAIMLLSRTTFIEFHPLNLSWSPPILAPQPTLPDRLRWTSPTASTFRLPTSEGVSQRLPNIDHVESFPRTLSGGASPLVILPRPRCNLPPTHAGRRTHVRRPIPQNPAAKSDGLLLPHRHHRLSLRTPFYRPMLSLRAVRAPEDPVERTQVLADMLLAGERQQQDGGGDGAVAGAAVVYVTLQRTAVEVAQALVAAGIAARPYHAGLPALEREVCVMPVLAGSVKKGCCGGFPAVVFFFFWLLLLSSEYDLNDAFRNDLRISGTRTFPHCCASQETQDWFMNAPDGASPVIVGTIAFGMGLDKKDVRRVFHFNLPKSPEDLAQQVCANGLRYGLVDCCACFFILFELHAGSNTYQLACTPRMHVCSSMERCCRNTYTRSMREKEEGDLSPLKISRLFRVQRPTVYFLFPPLFTTCTRYIFVSKPWRGPYFKKSAPTPPSTQRTPPPHYSKKTSLDHTIHATHPSSAILLL